MSLPFSIRLINILQASTPMAYPFCSTVVSDGSDTLATFPSPKPQICSCSGTDNPFRLATYKTPAAVSSLMAKNASSFLWKKMKKQPLTVMKWMKHLFKKENPEKSGLLFSLKLSTKVELCCIIQIV